MNAYLFTHLNIFLSLFLLISLSSLGSLTPVCDVMLILVNPPPVIVHADIFFSLFITLIPRDCSSIRSAGSGRQGLGAQEKERINTSVSCNSRLEGVMVPTTARMESDEDE